MKTQDQAQNNKRVNAEWDDLIAPISFAHIRVMAREGKTLKDLKEFKK
jgi:hypothetical protein